VPHSGYFGLGADFGQVLCTANTTNSLFKTPLLQIVFGSYSLSPDLETRKYTLEELSSSVNVTFKDLLQEFLSSQEWQQTFEDRVPSKLVLWVLWIHFGSDSSCTHTPAIIKK